MGHICIHDSPLDKKFLRKKFRRFQPGDFIGFKLECPYEYCEQRVKSYQYEKKANNVYIQQEMVEYNDSTEKSLKSGEQNDKHKQNTIY